MPEKKNKQKKAAPRRGKRAADMRGVINVRALIEALEQHVLGEKEMTTTQVSAALALLKKTLPDVSDAKRAASEKDTPAAHEDALKELE